MKSARISGESTLNSVAPFQCKLRDCPAGSDEVNPTFWSLFMELSSDSVSIRERWTERERA